MKTAQWLRDAAEVARWMRDGVTEAPPGGVTDEVRRRPREDSAVWRRRKGSVV